MRYNGCHIMIPYFDADGMKQWVKIHVASVIDRRKVWRGVRKYVKDNFKKKVSNDWVKAHCIIAGEEYTNPKRQCAEARAELRTRMDELYLQLWEAEQNADQNRAYSSTKVEDTGSSGDAVRPVQNQSSGI